MWHVGKKEEEGLTISATSDTDPNEVGNLEESTKSFVEG